MGVAAVEGVPRPDARRARDHRARLGQRRRHPARGPGRLVEPEGLCEQRVGEGQGDSTMSDDPERRTSLAVERTYLAWWRTGLTGFAVALATARVVPELSHSRVQWPYTLVGVGFALFGCACFALGDSRRRRGEREDAHEGATLALVAVGVLLGLGLVVVLAFEP